MKKNILKFLFVTLFLLPTMAEAAFPINTANRNVLVIWNNDIVYDNYFVDGGSGNNLIDLLTSTGGTWAGAGFNFTVTQLQVPSTFNNGLTWGTAGSAIANAVAAHTIQPLTAANYCMVFDMRFVNNNALISGSGGTQVPGTVAGDTITPGDITEYQNYLSSGAGGLFILGDNYYTGACGSGTETGFISRQENMGTMIAAVAQTGWVGGSCAVNAGPQVGVGDYEVQPSGVIPYGLNTTFNAGLPVEETDYSGPVSLVNLGSGHAWFQHQTDPWAVGIAWDGASGDLQQPAYATARMIYWGDTNMLSYWAGQPPNGTLYEYLENAVAFLDQDSCCMPPNSPVCGGPDIKLTAGNPTVVACFESNTDGWSTGTWDGTQDEDASGGGSLKGTVGEWSNAVVFQDSFAAGTLATYDTIDFWMRNPNPAALTFDIADALYGTIIAGPFTIPAGGAWTHFTETLIGDFATTATLVFENETAPGVLGETVNLDEVRLRLNCSSHLYLRDPACCSVVDTPTFTNTPTKTYTSTFTSTPTFTFTNTYTPTFTNTFTATPTNTLANSPTFTNTFTSTPTSTFTNTPVDTFTFTNTYTSTPTLTFTNTPQNSFTFTNTYTSTPTQTYTNTPVNTFTVTNTFTNTPTQTYTNTFVNSPTFTNTFTNTFTPTFTNTPVNTFTFTNTFTSTNTSTPTLTFTITPTNTPTMTFTVTPTPATFVGFGKTVSETQANAGDVLTYNIAVTVSGAALTNGVITDVLPANMTFQAFGSMPAGTTTSSPAPLQWNLPSSLAPGIYDLTYQTKVNTFAPANVPLTNNAQLTYTGGGPFKASVPVTVIGQFSVAVNIYNAAGEVVKTIPIQYFSTAINNISLSTTNTITTLSGQGSTIDILYNGYVIGTWNGTNNSNQPVANGSYQIQIASVSAAGVVTSVSQTAIVNRSLAGVEVDIYNEAGEQVDKLFNVFANATTANMTNVVLSSTVLQPNTNNANNGVATVLQILVQDTSAPVALTWNGTNTTGTYVTPGIYDIEVHWTNGNGATTDITRTIMVVPSVGVGGLAIARPNILNAANGMITTFDVSSVTNAVGMKVKIYTLAGELVQAFVSGTPTATWNASGLASGIYIANVEVDNAAGGVVNNQRLKILVLH